jgi:hypothetical protein
MQKLQLPEYTFRLKEKTGKKLIFDEFRQKWVVLTPEEWVRQRFLKYLASEKHFPGSLLAVEKKVLINGLYQRFDLLVYDRKGKPLLIAEFKAPTVEITRLAFDQAIRYNTVLKAPFFLISNGLTHFLCRVDFENRKTEYLNGLPDYSSLLLMSSGDPQAR